jgi:hypothetical protein
MVRTEDDADFYYTSNYTCMRTKAYMYVNGIEKAVTLLSRSSHTATCSIKYILKQLLMPL